MRAEEQPPEADRGPFSSILLLKITRRRGSTFVRGQKCKPEMGGHEGTGDIQSKRARAQNTQGGESQPAARALCASEYVSVRNLLRNRWPRSLAWNGLQVDEKQLALFPEYECGSRARGKEGSVPWREHVIYLEAGAERETHCQASPAELRTALEARSGDSLDCPRAAPWEAAERASPRPPAPACGPKLPPPRRSQHSIPFKNNTHVRR